MTVRELVNWLTETYVDWDKEAFVCISEKPQRSGESIGYTRYEIDRCTLYSPTWYINDMCQVVVGEQLCH